MIKVGHVCAQASHANGALIEIHDGFGKAGVWYVSD